MMSLTAQALYFHFGMNADDDGFCEHFTIMRMVEAKPDDLKVLQARGLVKVFDDKVLVILDWKENNLIRLDRYSPSKYLEEYKDEVAAISGIPVVDQRLTQVRLGKVSKDTAKADFLISKEEPEKSKSTTKLANAEYEEGLQWAEERAGRKFINRVKQYAALKKAKAAGIDNTKLMRRWKELEKEPFYQEHGLDWMMVISSFDKRI